MLAVCKSVQEDAVNDAGLADEENVDKKTWEDPVLQAICSLFWRRRYRCSGEGYRLGKRDALDCRGRCSQLLLLSARRPGIYRGYVEPHRLVFVGENGSPPVR